MSRRPTIIRIEDSHPGVRAAASPEARLLRHYELDFKVHHVRLNLRPERGRVLEAGEGPPVLMIAGGTGGERIEASLPNSCIEFVPTGNVPYLDRPQTCSRLIQPFLE